MKEVAQQVGNIFRKLFSENSISKLARTSGFVKRKRGKLNGYAFLLAMTLGRFKKSAAEFVRIGR